MRDANTRQGNELHGALCTHHQPLDCSDVSSHAKHESSRITSGGRDQRREPIAKDEALAGCETGSQPSLLVQARNQLAVPSRSSLKRANDSFNVLVTAMCGNWAASSQHLRRIRIVLALPLGGNTTIGNLYKPAPARLQETAGL
jgi:hypothetical protein